MANPDFDLNLGFQSIPFSETAHTVYQVNKSPPGSASQTRPRGIYVMPRVRRISAVAHYHRRAPVEAIFGDAIPEQRGVSISLPFET